MCHSDLTLTEFEVAFCLHCQSTTDFNMPLLLLLCIMSKDIHYYACTDLHIYYKKAAPHLALCLGESSLEAADFLVLALLGLLKLFLTCQVLLKGVFSLLELPLKLLNLVLTGLSLRLD